VFRLAAALLRRLWSSRASRAAALILLIGVLALASTRVLALRTMQMHAASNGTIALLEAPVAQHLASEIYIYRKGPAPDTGPDQVLIGRGSENLGLAPMATSVLQVFALFGLPIVGLAFGSAFVPEQGKLRLMLHTLPLRKASVFGAMILAMTLMWLILGLCLVAIYMVVILIGFPNGAAWLGIVTVFTSICVLYGWFFCALGLGLSALLRERSTALVVGLLVVVFLTIGLPAVRGVIMFRYQLIQDPSYLSDMARGLIPPDGTYKLLQVLGKTPSALIPAAVSVVMQQARRLLMGEAVCALCVLRPGDLSKLWILVVSALPVLGVGLWAYTRREVLE